jgi:hypothetical protein
MKFDVKMQSHKKSEKESVRRLMHCSFLKFLGQTSSEEEFLAFSGWGSEGGDWTEKDCIGM